MLKLLFFLLLAAGPLWSQDQYQGMVLPPHQVFNAMQGYAETGNWAALKKSEDDLEPLFAALEKAMGEDARPTLKRAISRKDRAAAAEAVTKILWLDLRFNIRKAKLAHGGRPGVDRLEIAFMDYSFLALDLRELKGGLEADHAVRSLFKQAYQAAEDPHQFEDLVQQIIERLSPHFKAEAEARRSEVPAPPKPSSIPASDPGQQ